MSSKKQKETQLTPWDDIDSFTDLHHQPYFKTMPNTSKHRDCDDLPNFPSITKSRNPRPKQKLILSFYDRCKSIKANKSNTIYSRKPSPPNTKVLFPIKTSTVHIQNVQKVAPQKMKTLVKANTSTDQILTICNNSLIKVKLLNKNRRTNKCKMSLTNLLDKKENSGKDRSLNSTFIENELKRKYKKASLLKIKSLLLG